MWGVFTGMAFVAVTFSRLIGAEQTRLMLLSWTIAEWQTLVVEVRSPARGARARSASPRARGRRLSRSRASRARPQEPLIIAISAIIPFIMDRLTSNAYAAEVVNSLWSSTIGACISS